MIRTGGKKKGVREKIRQCWDRELKEGEGVVEIFPWAYNYHLIKQILQNYQRTVK